MISKELLKEVLDIEGVVLEIAVIGNLLRWADTSNYVSARKINIHELAHKCKEWANSKGYMIKSTTNGTAQYKGFASVSYTEKRLGDTLKNFGLVSTEVEAIFKACEWILKQKEKNEK